MATMAIKPKQILDTAVELGKAAAKAGVDRVRGDKDEPASPPVKLRPKAKPTTSGAPASVGAAKPGAPAGPKSATAKTRKPAKAKAKKPAKAKANKPAKAKAKPAPAEPAA
jgi:hypothetical protein